MTLICPNEHRVPDTVLMWREGERVCPTCRTPLRRVEMIPAATSPAVWPVILVLSSLVLCVAGMWWWVWSGG